MTQLNPKHSHNKTLLFTALKTSLFMALITDSHAAGFFNYYQSARTAGTAGSLATVGEYDASAIFYNPAGLPKSKNTRLTVSTPIGKPSIEFENTGTSNLLGQPVSGNNNTKEDIFYAPNAAVTFSPDNSTTWGIGIYSPFGQVREYDSNWAGRYHALKADLKTITINPSVRYDINDSISAGFALQAEYAELQLDNALDFGGICVATQGLAPCLGMGLIPMQADGKQSLKGDDWALGYSLGLLLKPSLSIDIGLAYRSKIEHTLSGNASFSIPTSALPLTAGGSFTDSAISMKMTLPEVFSIGSRYRLNSKINLYADAALTRWSRFKSATVNYANPAQPDLTLNQNWKNSWRIALGGEYNLNDSSTLSFGVAHDNTPIPSTTVGAIIPDNDYWTYSIGYLLHLTKNTSINLAFVRTDLDDFKVNNYVPEFGLLKGNYKISNNVLGLQMNWQF